MNWKTYFKTNQFFSEKIHLDSPIIAFTEYLASDTSWLVVVVNNADLNLIEAEYKVLILRTDEAFLFPKSYYSFIISSFLGQAPKLMKFNFLWIKKKNKKQ